MAKAKIKTIKTINNNNKGIIEYKKDLKDTLITKLTLLNKELSMDLKLYQIAFNIACENISKGSNEDIKRVEQTIIRCAKNKMK